MRWPNFIVRHIITFRISDLGGTSGEVSLKAFRERSRYAS